MAVEDSDYLGLKVTMLDHNLREDGVFITVNKEDWKQNSEEKERLNPKRLDGAKSKKIKLVYQYWMIPMLQ